MPNSREMEDFHAHIREMSGSPVRSNDEKPFVDYWGEEWVSPKKERRELKGRALRRGMELSTGPLFKSVNSVLFNVLRVHPKTLMKMEVFLLNLIAVGRILFNTCVAMLNPVDNLYLDRSWPSINFFTGSIFIPRFNMAKAFPFWLRPAQIRRLEWNAIRILVSLSGGIHIAVDVEKFNFGFIIEEVVRDRSKHRAADYQEADLGFDTHNGSNGNESTRRRGGTRKRRQQEEQQQTPQNVRDARSKKKRAKEKVKYFSEAFRKAMEKLKGYGVNIALNIDEMGVGMDFTKLELDGTITRSDDWWEQGTHIRALDVGVTLSTGKSASFVSWEVLELRFLEDDDSETEEDEEEDEEEEEEEDGRYFHLTPVGGEGDNSSDAGIAPLAAGGGARDEVARVQQDIARQLFEDGSETSSTTGGGARNQLQARHGNGTGNGRGKKGKGRRPKDSFARALEDAPLLSLSSFSCGANVFLELAQMDFSSRTAMMSKYGEIKRLYRTSNQYSASGPVGTSASAHFARRKHQHIRGEMPGGASLADYDYDVPDGQEDDSNDGVVSLANASRAWGMTMSAVAVSVFYAYAKAKAGK